MIDLIECANNQDGVIYIEQFIQWQEEVTTQLENAAYKHQYDTVDTNEAIRIIGGNRDE